MVLRGSGVLLWLLVVNLGIAFGAGVYEARITVPDWIQSDTSGEHWHAQAAREDDTGLRFWVAVTTVPLTLLTIGNLCLGWRASGKLRRWWLGAATAALADRVVTFAYFIPTMIGLMAMSDSPEAVVSASRWADLNHVRHLILLIAWLAALQAFALWHIERDMPRR